MLVLECYIAFDLVTHLYLCIQLLLSMHLLLPPHEGGLKIISFIIDFGCLKWRIFCLVLMYKHVVENDNRKVVYSMFFRFIFLNLNLSSEYVNYS